MSAEPVVRMPRVTLSMLGLLLLSAPAPAGQRAVGPVTRDAAPVFSSGVDMVTVNASVRDSRGRLVRGLALPGLPARRQRVRTSHPQRVRERRAAPHRGAARHERQHGRRRQHRPRPARREDRRRLVAAGPRRGPRCSRSTPRCARWCRSRGDLTRFGQADLAGRPYGRTSLYDAVADTATLVGGSGDRHGALLVVTDGVDTGSRRTVEEVSGGRERHRRAGASAHGRRGGSTGATGRAARADPTAPPCRPPSPISRVGPGGAYARPAGKGICLTPWQSCCRACGISTW